MGDPGRAPFKTWSLSPGAREPVTQRELVPARTRAGGSPELPLRVAIPLEGEVREVIELLRSSRMPLLDRPSGELAESLGRVAARFLDPTDPLREEALDLLPGSTGLSAPMCRRVLDGMARDWTPQRLGRLVEVEFPLGTLDGFARVGPERRRIRTLGPSVAFHLAAGTVPGVSLTSLIRSLLVKTPVLLKPGRGDVVLPVLFHRALIEADPALARAAAVVYWPGGSNETAGAEDAALSMAGLVVAYGGTSTIEELRRRLPATTPLVAYHHRVSVAAVGPQGMAPDAVKGVASGVAGAAAMFDQRGCVSPLAVYAVGGGIDGARLLAGAIADSLAELVDSLPPGRMDEDQASAVRRVGDTDALRMEAGDVEVWGGKAAGWSVVLERRWDHGRWMELSCLGRTVRVLPVEDMEAVARSLMPLARHLQSVGYAGFRSGKLQLLAELLARTGVLRLAPIEELAFPPPWWLHDGAGPLDVLVKRVELGDG